MDALAYLIKRAMTPPHGTPVGRFFADIGETLSVPAENVAGHLGATGFAGKLNSARRGHLVERSIAGGEGHARTWAKKLKDMGLDVLDPQTIRLDRSLVPSPLRYTEEHHKLLRNLGAGTAAAGTVGIGAGAYGAKRLIHGRPEEEKT